MKTKNKSSEKKEAFSLLEMLVAMTLFFIFAMLLFSLSTHVWQRWFHEQRLQQSTSEALLLLQRMKRDLRSAVILPHSFFLNLPIADTRCRKNIFFLTTIATSTNEGDLCAVGYFFIEEKNAPQMEHCYRFSASTQETQQALQENRLYELFARASPAEHSCCQEMAASLQSVHFEPAWRNDGRWCTAAPSALQEPAEPAPAPSLLEITLTAASERGASSLASAPIFSTVVALSAARKLEDGRWENGR